MSFESTSNPEYSKFIALSKYARWLPEAGRRETWEETVNRYVDFWVNRGQITESEAQELFDAIYNLEVMPSMRALMTAGPALDRDNVAGFNCSYRELSGSGENIEVLTQEMRDAGIDSPVTIHVNSPIAFDEIMYILLCGTGVGFSVERQFIAQLPVIGHKLPRKIYEPTQENFPKVPAEDLSVLDTQSNIIQVADSKYGWASALRILIFELYNGNFDIRWDVSKVRPAGTPLKLFGGRASGPEPLIDLFNYVKSSFTKAKGRKLTSIEVHGLVCKIAEIVVVGGVRRSALISLSNLSDDRMRHAKSGSWWENNSEYALANNSACYTEKPDMETFMREWISLVESKSGERGIFNREASQKQAAKNGRRDPTYLFGTNPCCVTGDTLILTSEGHQPIADTVGAKVDIWNGQEWATVTPFETGRQPIFRVQLSDGTRLDCTANHKFVLDNGRKTKRIDGKKVDIGRHEVRKLASELEPGDKLFKYKMPVIEKGITYDIDAYSQGFYSGDGNTDLSYSWLYKPKYVCEERLVGTFSEEHSSVGRKTWKHGDMLPKDFVPLDSDLNYRLNWLAGILDSDGTVSNGGYQLSSTNLEFIRKTRLLLTTLGVQAKINLASPEGVRDFNDGYGEYNCKAVHRLLINQTDAQQLLDLGLSTTRLSLEKAPVQRDARRFVTVEKVTDLGIVEDTYCFTEPKNSTGTFNGIVTGQSEIILRNMQFCNLSEIVARAGDTFQDLKEKARIAAIIGTLQASLTDFAYLSPKWKQNTEEEALLGVSITGIMDHPVLSGNEDFFVSGTGQLPIKLPEVLDELKSITIETNKKWAARLGINQSAAITCVKPSGTVSQLVDSASGIHPRYSNYYIRTVRADKKDPLAQMMLDEGFPVADDVMNPNSTYVFSFPMKAPNNAIFRDDRDAIQQLEHWLTYQRYWCEHKPSVTIYAKDEEWLKVGAWVWDHFDEISGVSFLPHSDHTYRQAPYQEISKEEYEDWLEIMPEDVDWSLVGEYEMEDNTSGSQTLACTGGVCEVVDLVK